jgi:ABC-2 type transport system permease protein
MKKATDRTKYFNLIKELAITDFKLRYQGSTLGYLWSLMKPIMLFLVMYFVFTRIFRVGNDISHYPVYLLLGIVIWEFFVEVASGSMTAIVGQGDLIRKVYFPRIVLVISRSITALMTFSLNFIAVLLFMLYNGVHINWGILLFPLLVIELMIFIMGVSFFLSSLFVKFRDIGHIWDVVTRALFYATPILYPLSIVPQNLARIQILNPVAQILQDARYLLITHETITANALLTWKYLWIPYTIPVVVFVIGLIIFEKSAAKFAENV